MKNKLYNYKESVLHKYNIKKLLQKFGFHSLEERVSTLLNNYDGIEDSVEDKEELPSVYLQKILSELSYTAPEKRLDKLLGLASIMPCFYYRVSRNGANWNPLKQKLLEFDSKGEAEYWRDFQPYPSPVAIKEWFKEAIN